MNLEESEKGYLRLFLKLVEDKGVYGLVEACQNRDFAMYPFVDLIKKLVDDKEEEL